MDAAGLGQHNSVKKAGPPRAIAPWEERNVGSEDPPRLQGVGRARLYRRGELSFDVPPKRRRPRWILGRAGKAGRLAEALHQGQEHNLRVPEHLDQMVRGRRPQYLRQLHRPASQGPRRPGRHPLGGRQSGGRQEDHLPRIARTRLPARQRHEGARRQEGRPRHDLHADDTGDGLRDARLRQDRRRPFRRLRRLLARTRSPTASRIAVPILSSPPTRACAAASRFRSKPTPTRRSSAPRRTARPCATSSSFVAPAARST